MNDVLSIYQVHACLVGVLAVICLAICVKRFEQINLEYHQLTNSDDGNQPDNFNERLDEIFRQRNFNAGCAIFSMIVTIVCYLLVMGIFIYKSPELTAVFNSWFR